MSTATQRLPKSHAAEFDAVPMEYRAQIENRCKRQYPGTGDAATWVKEWIAGSSEEVPFSVKNLRFLKVRIDWRLVSNSGIDEGVIRPVAAAGGWPVIPGSSIKGLFRRACSRLHPGRLASWCGSPPDRRTGHQGSHGLLRFHGAWPTGEHWQERLLDVVHGQQKWQIWDPDFDRRSQSWSRKIQHNANAIISLYQPELCVAISGTEPTISEAEWATIMDTLQEALSQGIGGRTCAGYGAIGSHSGSKIFECWLEGQGIASTLLSRDQGEFRPNMFRAAVRGMALRLFGGLCSDSEARAHTGRLFGSIDRLDGGLQRGLLECRFTDYRVAMQKWGSGRLTSHCFAVRGLLQWHQTKDNLSSKQTESLANLIASLHALVICLGGFGRSWRRPDHFIFYPEYYQQNQQKPAIGCHWQWSDPSTLIDHPDWAIASAAMLSELLGTARRHAQEWRELNPLERLDSRQRQIASWRDVIHPEYMAVWVREAMSPEDSEALLWFHREPEINKRGKWDPRGLKSSSMAGYVKRGWEDPRVTEVSRIWHRMLPCVNADSLRSWLEHPDSGLQVSLASITPWSGDYREVLVLFQDRHLMDPDPAHQRALTSILDADDSPFQRVPVLTP